ncbi:hypothetical protein FRC19_007947 [Serendipita sp. 401]|nr:hypothetical protein FRC19_007947 [Serendipita sp. 401]KAG9056850.1 hypothetical protein FS842_009370 [Serendipita sp. 407]
MPKRRAGSSAVDVDDMNNSNHPTTSTSTSASDSQHERLSKRRRLGEPESASQARASKRVKTMRRLRARLAAETRHNTQIVDHSKADEETEDPSAPPTPHSLPRQIPSPVEKEDEELLVLRMLLKERDQQIEEQKKALNSIHQQVQCQICLESFSRPFALVPCGHVCCLGCLQQWFKAPPPDDALRPRVPLTRRKKTCPHCRATVTQRPVEVFVLKEIISHLEPAIRATPGPPRPVANPENPWTDIFPETFHGADETADGALIDHQDGGIRRCRRCLTEIYQGYCGWCGEYYGSDFSEDEDIAEEPMPPGAFPWRGYTEGEEDEDEDEDSDLDVYEEDFIDDRDETGTVIDEESDDSDGSEIRDNREDDIVLRQVAVEGNEPPYEEVDNENGEVGSDLGEYGEDEDVESDRGYFYRTWRESDNDRDITEGSNVDDDDDEPAYMPRYDPWEGWDARPAVGPPLMEENRRPYFVQEISDHEEDEDDSSDGVVQPRYLRQYDLAPRYGYVMQLSRSRVYNDIEDWEDEEGELR